MQRPIIQKGTILIARPTLLTDLFNRSVVLITDHSDTGSIGFILNKTTDIPVNNFIEEIKSEAKVFEGGPVDQENLFFLHKRPDLIVDSEVINKELYWSGKFNNVVHALNTGLITSEEIRFYLGYSGWTSNQLEEEVKNNAWNVVNDVKIDIFQDWSSDLWQRQMKKLGGENLLWSNMPDNPTLN